MPVHPAISTLLAARGLDPAHPAAVEAEAAAWVAAPGIDDPALTDLTALPFVTIDEVHSLDLDQAVFIAEAGDGHVVWYALADAANYVRAGSALFDEALRRGASYYVPGVVVPMLPRSLSEGLISLMPEVDRRALVFRVTLDARGEATATELIRARVRSRQKLAWPDVQAFYDGQPSRVSDEVGPSLRALAVVGSRRMALSEERAIVRFRRQEVDVGIAEDGLRFVTAEDLRRDVERFNEQISVLCNVEGARFLQAGRPDLVQPIYRVHVPPSEDRVRQFAAQIAGLVTTRRLSDSWRWDPAREGLAHYLDRLPTDGPDARVAAAIHRQAVVTSGEASFTAAPGAHAGLGADVYARFTAPMREIVGIFLHEEALELLAGAPMPVPAGTPDDEELRTRVIAASNRAKEVQKQLDRDVNRLVLDQLFTDARSAGGGLVGTVMGLTPGKVHVRLDDPPVDVKVYVDHLERRVGRVFLQPDGNALRRREDRKSLLKVGDTAVVRVVGHDPAKDRWDLDVCRAESTRA